MTQETPRTRRLFLLRHAKSSWDDASQDDHERPLNARGTRAAALMGAYLAQRSPAPSLVLCSTARRARETLDALLEHLSEDTTLRIDQSLYLAAPESLLDALRAAPDTAASILLVGHNPGIEQLASALARSGPPDAIRRMRAKFPTAAVAELEAEIERWRDLEPAGAQLVEFCTPKDLV